MFRSLLNSRLSTSPQQSDASRELSSDENEDRWTPPPLPDVLLEGYTTQTVNRLNSQHLAAEIRPLMPQRIQLYSTWRLIFSLEQHGASLSTLYDRMAHGGLKAPVRQGYGSEFTYDHMAGRETANNTRTGYVLIVKDASGSIFGAYVNEYFHVTESRRFYGNGECFLWRTVLNNDKIADDADPSVHRFEAFPYTGLNDFTIFCTHNFLSMGGGDGHYGLWLDDSLAKGVSQRSLTYGNPPLSGQGDKFDIIGLEVWKVG